MSTQFHALRLPYGVVQAVVNLTSKYGIDLNSVSVTPQRVIIGELRCGKFVHVHRVTSEHYNVSLCDVVTNEITNHVKVTI